MAELKTTSTVTVRQDDPEARQIRRGSMKYLQFNDKKHKQKIQHCPQCGLMMAESRLNSAEHTNTKVSKRDSTALTNQSSAGSCAPLHGEPQVRLRAKN